MMEINPRITYSPERVLEIRTTFPKNVAADWLEEKVQTVADDPNCDVFESGQGFIVKVNPSAAMHSINSTEYMNHDLMEDFVNKIKPFTFSENGDNTDGVFSLEFWGQHGGKGVMHPQLQKWLNAKLVTEELARDVFDAMILPYSRDTTQDIAKRYRFTENSNGLSAGDGAMSVSLSLADTKVGITQLIEEPAEFVQQTGVASWRMPFLSTLGDCACWGVDGHERDLSFRLTAPKARLHKMNPHNIDSYPQSLSLVLGMARLAYEAAQYDSDVDLIASTEWVKKRHLPKQN
jgi:hypothetical protein